MTTGMDYSLPASIELSPKQARENHDLRDHIPTGTRVYITDIGTDSEADMVAAVKSVTNQNMRATPHIPARRFESNDALERRLKRYADEGGAKSILAIAGEADRTMGPFDATQDVLNSGFVQAAGIKEVAVAGHPEGNPNIKTSDVNQPLFAKQQWAQDNEIDMWIATQFGFDPDLFINWADKLPYSGITLPVHIGLAGPAKITTLLKYAAMCGVGNSLNFLKKRGGALASLALSYDPNTMIQPIEDHAASSTMSPIKGLHFFPFGGYKKTGQWLVERGTWDIKTSLYADI